MFDAAVAAGVAAFLDGDEPREDDEIIESLVGRGVRPWLAHRLVAFLPLAFGRTLLAGATLADSFVDGMDGDDRGSGGDGSDGDGSGGGRDFRRLGDDPVFVAATARAARASRVELERIGLRSPEVSAASRALHAGSALADLVLGPVVLAEPLPPADDTDGGVPSPRLAFADLLRGHGFTVEDGDGLRVGELALDARLFPHRSKHGVIVQVDFEVRHPALAHGVLLESFGGAGADWHASINQAIMKFERASLHPVIAALLDRSACADQVGWEPYRHPGGIFDLCVGPQLGLYSPQPPPPAGPLLDALLDALRGVELTRAVHALRIFTCHEDGALTTNEVLLDNEAWPEGEAVVAGMPAPTATDPIGSRLFCLLVPA